MRQAPLNEPAQPNHVVSRRSVLFGGAAAGAAGVGGLALLGRAPGASATTSPTTDLPTYAAPVATNTYDPARNVYNWKGSNTRRHRAGLARAASGGRASQIFIGDSLTSGCVGGTQMDRLHAWPRAYSATLDALGYPSAGSGLVRIMDGILRSDFWTVSGAWYGLYPCAVTSSAGSYATMSVPDSGTTVGVVFAGTTSATSVTISVDGATSGTGYLTVAAGGPANTVRRVELTGLDNQPHTVKVTCAGGTLILIGAEVLRDTGLRCHNVAQGGSTASLTGQGSWTDTAAAFGTRLLPLYGAASGAYGDTPTTVHCSLGGNDVSKGQTPAQVAAAISTLRAACPDSDFILYFEPQPAELTMSQWAPLGEALYALADSLDVPLIDLHDRLGGYAVEAANGLTGDTVAHLNAAGYADWGRGAAFVAAC
jgi:lysophospholipase L1-like esterase